MKPVSEYKTIDEWKEDMEKSGQPVSALLYITLSKIMEDKHLTVAESIKYLHESGKVIWSAIPV